MCGKPRPMEQMYLYIISNPAFLEQCIVKIGRTIEPYGRRSTYLTGCPPGLTPSQDLEYVAIWETTAITLSELDNIEDEVHNHFLRYRMIRKIPGDSEWFNFQGKTPYDEVDKFMKSRPWVKRQVLLSEI